MKTKSFNKVSFTVITFLIITSFHSCKVDYNHGTIGSDLKWEFIQETGELIIFGEGSWPTFEEQVYDNVISDLYSKVDKNQVNSVTIREGVKTIGWSALSGCQMTSVSIPNSVTTIEVRAFEKCTNLLSVTIPNSVTTLGSDAFSMCSGLTTLQIGDGVTIIHSEHFRRCKELTTVTLGDGITTIEWRAFSDNDKLDSVTLGRNITNIGNDAFSWANTISEFTILNPVPPEINYSVFYATTIKTLYVPSESVELYKNSENWKKAKNIVGIETEK